MEVIYKDRKIDIEPNSKPYLFKRIVAEMFDIGLLFVLFFVVCLGLFNSNLSSTYYDHSNRVSSIQDSLKLESGYGEKKYVDDDYVQGYKVYYDESTGSNYIVVKNESADNDNYVSYMNLLSNNDIYQEEVFAADLHRYLISALSCLIGETVLFLIIPLCNKQRSTIGQLLMGISLFDLSRQAYAKWYQVLFRFLFIFFIESCLMYLWTGIYTFLLIPVITLIFVLLSKNDRCLRDYLTGTMLIEKLSYR